MTVLKRLNEWFSADPGRAHRDLWILCEAPLAFLLLFSYPQYVDLSRKMAELVCASAPSAITVFSRKLNIAIIVVVILGVIVAGPA